ncbi:MAG: hypothetical protein NC412_04150 [Roseburia sp.]|nr:hypothetical protein [Roseburia sp.]MCM1278096.1 hypothetical protein [Robinsoniella sp.]
MKRTLGIVSTTYHLLVFLFLKEIYLKDSQIDLIVTDKTPYLEKVYKSGRLNPYFHRVLFADGRKIQNPYKSAAVTFFESFLYNPTTKKILSGKLDNYDDVYYASPHVPDEIVKEIGKTLIRQSRNIRFHRFEDGFASYTKTPVPFINTEAGQKMYQKLLGYDIHKMEHELYMFEPYLAEADISFDKIRIEKTPEIIDRVIKMAKNIFAFESKEFSEKFLFLGQGTANGMGNPETYQSLIYEICQKAGHHDFIVKPHPRGVYDKFDSTISIYEDSCPFELAMANGLLEDKVLISYYSTACVSGKLLFQSKCKIIFLYPLAGDSFNEKCDYEEYFRKLQETCEGIYIPRSREELFGLVEEFTHFAP